MNNIKQSIFTVFPKHILCLDNVCLEDLDIFNLAVHKLIEQDGTYTNNLLNVKSTHRTNSNLHKYEEFQSLVKVIEQATIQFGNILGYDGETCFRMFIGNMWANLNDQGGYNFPHIHSGSILSGVFYVKTPPENQLVFFEDFSSVHTATERYGEGYDFKSFSCYPGRLLMFKSDLIHAAPPQKNTGEKIAISFNIVR